MKKTTNGLFFALLAMAAFSTAYVGCKEAPNESMTDDKARFENGPGYTIGYEAARNVPQQTFGKVGKKTFSKVTAVSPYDEYRMMVYDQAGTLIASQLDQGIFENTPFFTYRPAAANLNDLFTVMLFARNTVSDTAWTNLEPSKIGLNAVQNGKRIGLNVGAQYSWGTALNNPVGPSTTPGQPFRLQDSRYVSIAILSAVDVLITISDGTHTKNVLLVSNGTIATGILLAWPDAPTGQSLTVTGVPAGTRILVDNKSFVGTSFSFALVGGSLGITSPQGFITGPEKGKFQFIQNQPNGGNWSFIRGTNTVGYNQTVSAKVSYSYTGYNGQQQSYNFGASDTVKGSFTATQGALVKFSGITMDQQGAYALLDTVFLVIGQPSALYPLAISGIDGVTSTQLSKVRIKIDGLDVSSQSVVNLSAGVHQVFLDTVSIGQHLWQPDGYSFNGGATVNATFGSITIIAGNNQIMVTSHEVAVPTPGDVTPPGNVSGVTSTVTAFTATLSFTPPLDSDYDGVRVYQGATLLGTKSGLAWDIKLTGLLKNTSYTVTIKTKDMSGNEQTTGVSHSFTTNDTTAAAQVINPSAVALAKASGTRILTLQGDTSFALKIKWYFGEQPTVTAASGWTVQPFTPGQQWYATADLNPVTKTYPPIPESWCFNSSNVRIGHFSLSKDLTQGSYVNPDAVGMATSGVGTQPNPDGTTTFIPLP